MNDRILSDPPECTPRPDGYAQGCIWCVALGFGLLLAVAGAIMAGVA